MKNPFEYRAPAGYPVRTLVAATVDCQMDVVRKADAKKLAEIIAWPGSGSTIRKAAASRLRKLQKKGGPS
ncbi:MAG TPA: hypothetical protein PKE26_11120 [Kiritimatiellia bacterium]|nr:hypothetical protein [Kiritimatiellia bacterium]